MTHLTKNIAEMIRKTEEHIATDTVAQGFYWSDGKGCFIGCLTHSDNAQKVTDQYGIPLLLVRICENVFEGLPDGGAKQFFADIAPAIGQDGKDLSLVHWQFLESELRALSSVDEKTQAAIDGVIKGISRLAHGEDWSKEEALAAMDAAADASYAADAAAYAADAAADASYASASYAAYAADAACKAAACKAAARNRQAATIIDLLKNAPVVEDV